MSRRHTSPRPPRPMRILAGTLGVLLAAAVILPGLVLAQGGGIRDQDVQQRWQLLTYRDADGDIVPVPAGVSATVLLFADTAIGDSACSEYRTTYTRQRDSISFDLASPEIQRFECDPASQTFDDAFYSALADATSLTVSPSSTAAAELDSRPSIMTLYDNIKQPLMTLTSAVIDRDPTVARWDLTRIGTADGSVEPVLTGLSPWIEFLRGGRLVGDTGCGSMYGSYTVNEGTMSITDVAYRLEGCPDTVRRQAEQVIGSLAEITDFEVLPAGLALKGEGGVTRLALAPSIDLGERTWTPIDIVGASGESLFSPGQLSTSAVKLFGREAQGRSICRYFTGDSLSSGLALSISDLVLEGDACNKKLTAVEDAFMKALEQTASQALRGSELELKDVGGNTLMRLLPQAPLIGPTWVLDRINVTPNKAKVKRRKPSGELPTALFEDITEVVSGDTGAGDNRFVAAYRTPAASRLDVSGVEPTGDACGGKRQGRPECKQQARFLALLDRVDGYIAREGELRLLEGNKPLLWFVPEAIDTTTE